MKRIRLIYISLAVLIIAVLADELFASYGGSIPSRGLIIVLLHVALGVATLWYAPKLETTGKRDPFNPNTLAFSSFLFTYCIGSFAHLASGNALAIYALKLSLLGMVCFFIGVSMAGTDVAHFKRKVEIISRQKLAIASATLLFISILATLFLVATQGIPILYEDKLMGRLDARRAVSSWVIYAIRVAMLVVFALVIYCGKNRIWGKKTKIALGFLWLFVALINLVPGWRGPVILFALATVIAIHYSWSSMGVFRAGVGLLAVAVIALGWGFFRLVGTGDNSTAFVYLSNNTANGIELFWIWLIGSTSVYMLGFLEVISAIPGKLGFQFGSVALMTVATALPGEQKTFGALLKDVSGLDFDGVILNSSVLGDAYADGGLVGIVLHMLFFGYLLGFVYRKVRSGVGVGVGVFVTVFYIYIISSFIMGTMTGILSQAIYVFQVFVLWLYARYSRMAFSSMRAAS